MEATVCPPVFPTFKPPSPSAVLYPSSTSSVIVPAFTTSLTFEPILSVWTSKPTTNGPAKFI